MCGPRILATASRAAASWSFAVIWAVLSVSSADVAADVASSSALVLVSSIARGCRLIRCVVVIVRNSAFLATGSPDVREHIRNLAISWVYASPSSSLSMSGEARLLELRTSFRSRFASFFLMGWPSMAPSSALVTLASGPSRSSGLLLRRTCQRMLLACRRNARAAAARHTATTSMPTSSARDLWLRDPPEEGGRSGGVLAGNEVPSRHDQPDPGGILRPEDSLHVATCDSQVSSCPDLSPPIKVLRHVRTPYIADPKSRSPCSSKTTRPEVPSNPKSRFTIRSKSSFPRAVRGAAAPESASLPASSATAFAAPQAASYAQKKKLEPLTPSDRLTAAVCMYSSRAPTESEEKRGARWRVTTSTASAGVTPSMKVSRAFCPGVSSITCTTRRRPCSSDFAASLP
mmetsp:Transcript_24465/g.77319  ORF Transcript_24465/g.77319 Transcript_24465/m.77319 type:complete len:403 (+) Transcript_24465:941-2149(+)